MTIWQWFLGYDTKAQAIEAELGLHQTEKPWHRKRNNQKTKGQPMEENICKSYFWLGVNI